MAFNNPAFRSEAFSAQGGVAAANQVSSAQLDEIYNRPAAGENGETMTVEDTVVKTVIAFVILVAGAAIGWAVTPFVPFLWIGAALVGLVLALVNIFRKKAPSRGLVLAYSAVQGVFLGGISLFYNQMFDGIVLQAVLATFAVVGVTLALFASGKIRASKRATKIFLIAMIGYGVFSLINLGVMFFGGAGGNPWGLRGSFEIFGIPLGLVLGVFVVLMAAYSLVLDFDLIQRGVRNRAPRAYAWAGVFGILVTVIWLYLEILRMLAISRD